MITLLLGEDDFSKTQFLSDLAKKLGQDILKYGPVDDLPDLKTATEPTLFGPAQLLVFESCLSKFSHDEVLAQAGAKSEVVFIETSLDKRKKDNTTLLKTKGVTVKEFPAPSGKDAVTWLSNHAKQLGGKFDKGAIEELAKILTPEPTGWPRIEPKLNVWQAHGEIDKLIAYADGSTVTSNMVEELVPNVLNGEVWEAINAIGERNRNKAFSALEKFYERSDEDEKAKTIQLSALMTDQFRNLLLVQDFTTRRVGDDTVLKQTGWKSGRLFVLKKLARGFTPTQLTDVLAKLENLDIELKTSTTPPRVIVDLILAQL